MKLKKQKTGRQALASIIARGSLYQRGGPLAHTIAFKDDSSAEVLDDAEFQQEIRSTLKAQETKFKSFQDMAAEMTTKIEDAPKKIIKLLEEIEALKTQANVSQANFDKFEKAINKFDASMKNVVKLEFGCPMERFLSDPDKRIWANAIVRKLAFPMGKLPDAQEMVLKEISGVDSSLGQATIPTQWFNEIYNLLSMYGVWKTFGQVPVGARTNTFPLAQARPTAEWIGAGSNVNEGTAPTEGSFTGASVNLLIQSAQTWIGITRELIQDSSVDISGYVFGELFQSISTLLDAACVSADGSADNVDGGYVGVFEAGSVNTQLKATAAAGNTTVDGTQLADWVRCLTTVNSKVLSLGAKWWLHPYTVARMTNIVDGNGRPIFQTALEAPSPGSIGRILGYPVILGDACPSTSAASAKIAVFGDPQGLAVGVRQDIELAQSEHYKFTANQIVYRAIMRAGCKLKTTTGSTVLKPFAVLTLPAA